MRKAVKGRCTIKAKQTGRPYRGGGAVGRQSRLGRGVALRQDQSCLSAGSGNTAASSFFSGILKHDSLLFAAKLVRLGHTIDAIHFVLKSRANCIYL